MSAPTRQSQCQPAHDDVPVREHRPQTLRNAREIDAYVGEVKNFLHQRIARGASVVVPAPKQWREDPVLAHDAEAHIEDAFSDITYDSALTDLLGPFWSTPKVLEELGYNSKQALGNNRSRGNVLAVKSGNGRLAYPTSQFHRRAGRAEVKPGQAAMFKVLKDDDPWMVAVLMHNTAPELDGQTPLQWERDGRPVARLVELAHRVRHEWVQ